MGSEGTSRGQSSDYSRMSNHYGSLGVGADATPPEIRSAFRKLVKETHPDVFAQGTPAHAAAEDRIKTLNVAYGILSRQRQREDYDRQLRLDTEPRRFAQQRRPTAGNPGGAESSTAPHPSGQGEARVHARSATWRARAEAAQQVAARQAHARAQAERDWQRWSKLDPRDQLRLVLTWGADGVAQRRQCHGVALSSASGALGALASHAYRASAVSGAEGNARLAVCLVAAYRELLSRGGLEPADLRDVTIETSMLLDVDVELAPQTRLVAVQVQAAHGRTATSWLFLSSSLVTTAVGLWVTSGAMITRSLLDTGQAMDGVLDAAATLVVGAAMFGVPVWALHWLSSFGGPRGATFETRRQLDVVDETRKRAASEGSHFRRP